MTTEELIKVAEERLAQVSMQLEVCNFSAGFWKIKENECDFLREVVSTLHVQQTPAKLDRNRWKGCEYCNEDKELMTLDFDIPDDVEIRDNSVGFRWNADPQYCPICGKPLTEEAWAELEKKLEV